MKCSIERRDEFLDLFENRSRDRHSVISVTVTVIMILVVKVSSTGHRWPILPVRHKTVVMESSGVHDHNFCYKWCSSEFPGRPPYRSLFYYSMRWSLPFLLFLLPQGGLAGKLRKRARQCKQPSTKFTNPAHTSTNPTHTSTNLTHTSTKPTQTPSTIATHTPYNLQISYQGESFLKYVVISLFPWNSLNRL